MEGFGEELVAIRNDRGNRTLACAVISSEFLSDLIRLCTAAKAKKRAAGLLLGGCRYQLETRGGRLLFSRVVHGAKLIFTYFSSQT